MSSIQITAEQFAKLEKLQNNKQFTEFYLQQYNWGSTISGLYIPGPTGQGVFGSYSHNVTSDIVGEHCQVVFAV